MSKLLFWTLILAVLNVLAGATQAQSSDPRTKDAIQARDLILRGEFAAAAKQLRSAVEAREPNALMLQGILHAAGAGEVYDHPLATDFWREAALAGQKDAAQLLLPTLQGQYAREWWLDRISALPEPAVKAPENMVRADRRGLVVENAAALKWVQRESAAGNAAGLYNAYHAARFGGRSDAAKARIRRLLERAAEMELPAAMRELSSELEQSLPGQELLSVGFKMDRVRAADVMRRAAELGDARAQLLWGHWLRSEKRDFKDPAAAVVFYRRASEQGNDYAAYFLYEAYSSGKGVEPSGEEAAKFLRLAAERGNDGAIRIYASRLFHGKGMKPDQSAAIRMLEPSLVCSLIPDEDAIALVAYAYATGSGVKRDMKKANWWARWAAEKGSDYAKQLLHHLKQEESRHAADGTGADPDPSSGNR